MMMMIAVFFRIIEVRPRPHEGTFGIVFIQLTMKGYKTVTELQNCHQAGFSIHFIAADDKCFVFRSKDLRPEAKNFKIFFVHTVSNYSIVFVRKFLD